MVAARPEYYSLTTVDVQGHAVPAPGFAPFQSPSRRMAGGRQEHASLTTVECGRAGTKCLHYPGLKRLFSSLMAVERQEHSSLATVEVQGYAVPSPPLTTVDVQWHAISGLYDSSLTTVVFQGHSVSGILRLPSPPVLRYGC